MRARLLMGAAFSLSLGTACTAIVFGQVDGRADAKVSDNINSSVDSCSLQKGNGYQSPDQPLNPCMTCIQNHCADDITYACNGGTDPKTWFRELKSCAQQPYVSGYIAPNDASTSFASTNWECSDYVDATDQPNDETDNARKAKAHNCVTNGCMQGQEPACVLCEVSFKSKEVEQPFLLRNDPCGKCIVDSCNAPLIAVCRKNEPIMEAYVEKCAYTASPANLEICKSLKTISVTDAGDGKQRPSYNGEYDHEVVDEFLDCVKRNCDFNSCAN